MKTYFKILVKRANLHDTFYSFCSNGSFLTWPGTKQKKKGFGKVMKKSAGCGIFVKKTRNAGSRQVIDIGYGLVSNRPFHEVDMFPI